MIKIDLEMFALYVGFFLFLGSSSPTLFLQMPRKKVAETETLLRQLHGRIEGLAR